MYSVFMLFCCSWQFMCQTGVYFALAVATRKALVYVLASIHEGVDVNASINAHAVQHVYHVFSGDVARGACCCGTVQTG